LAEVGGPPVGGPDGLGAGVGLAVGLGVGLAVGTAVGLGVRVGVGVAVGVGAAVGSEGNGVTLASDGVADAEAPAATVTASTGGWADSRLARLIEVALLSVRARLTRVVPETSEATWMLVVAPAATGPLDIVFGPIAGAVAYVRLDSLQLELETE
jgi:hypothetical protein